MSNLAIAQAARKLKLSVKADSVDTYDIRNVAPPASLHRDFNHFIVLENRSSKTIEIADPAIGRYETRKQDFDEKCTGAVLTFGSTGEFAHRNNAQSRNIYS